MSQTGTILGEALASALFHMAGVRRHDEMLAKHEGVADARLAYYASAIPEKSTWFQTDEGYRIYRNVPICRTGAQQYIGRELKKLPGYREEWNIADDDLVTVYRPLEEVTAPAAMASFEGKSVLDEHPPDPQVLVDALDEYDGVTHGHGQNIHAGHIMADGETCVLADLHVKHPDLNMKIEGGTREVSCGYRFVLDKDSSGRYVQTQIRGNHIAVVPRGRAGRLVGIGDAEVEVPIQKGNITMADQILSLGLHTLAKTATPEDFGKALDIAYPKGAGVKDADPDKAKEKADADEKAAKDKAAKDAKAVKDKEKADEDKAVADAMKELDEDGMDLDDMEKAGKEKGKTITDPDKEGAKDDDIESIIIPTDERPKSEFSVADAAKYLEALKPAVARSKDQGAKDAYKALRKGIKTVQTGVKDGVPDPFVALSHIVNDGGVADSMEEDVPAFQFFNGVSYQEGLKNYNEHLDRRSRR